MNWPDLSMGGYGFYVWGSYIFALIAFVWEVVSLRQRKRALRQQQQQRSNSVSPTVLTGKANETTS
jgi:heme exporter protein D